MRLCIWDMAALQYESFFVGQDFLCLGLVKKGKLEITPLVSTLPHPTLLRLCHLPVAPPTLPPPYPPSFQQGVQGREWEDTTTTYSLLPLLRLCHLPVPRQTDRQTHRQADRQTDRHTHADSQTDIHTQAYRPISVHVRFYRPMGVQRYSIRSP